MGDFLRMMRASTSQSGKWRLFRKGTGFGFFCEMRSAPPRTARSMITRCATSSAADHAPVLGLVVHWSDGTASAARKNALWASANFCTMRSSCFTCPTLPRVHFGRAATHFAVLAAKKMSPGGAASGSPVNLTTGKRRRPAQTRKLIAKPWLRRRLGRRFADPPAIFRRCGRKEPKCRAARLVTL